MAIKEYLDKKIDMHIIHKRLKIAKRQFGMLVYCLHQNNSEYNFLLQKYMQQIDRLQREYNLISGENTTLNNKF